LFTVKDEADEDMGCGLVAEEAAEEGMIAE